MAKKIRLAIAGVGNCASSLVQGLFYYRNVDSNVETVPGLMHNVLGGYRLKDVEPVAAFDVDKRKVGKDLSEAIFAKPNCTTVFQKDIPKLNCVVQKAPVLDGVATHMKDYPVDKSFVVSDEKPVDVTKILKERQVDVLINYVPVGSEDAAKYYAQACLDAGCGFVNGMPVFIASNAEWAKRFEQKGVPVVGDDFKSQLGATITHRMLVKLFSDRGVKVDRTYQLNTGGNSVTGEQNILLEVDGKLKRFKIGEFVDSLVNIYGEKRDDGKDIVDVQESGHNIRCFTIDNNYNVILSDVEGLVRHKLCEPLYELTTEEGRKIKITGDHNVFTIDDEGSLVETAVKNLKENQTYIAVPKSLLRTDCEELKSIDLSPHLNQLFFGGVSEGYITAHSQPHIRIPVEFPVTDQFLQITGIWLADGNYDRKISANIELACANDPECMEVVEDFLGEFGINHTVYRDGVRVRLLSKTLGNIFKTALGLTGNSYTKRFPEWVFGLSERQIAQVLRGYLSGDGCVTGNQIRWTSVSEDLINDIQTLFLLIGINSTIFKEKTRKESGYKTSCEYFYHGLISAKEDVELFIKKVGFLQEYKNKAAFQACENLTQYSNYRIPNIALLKKWKIKSSTLHKHSSIRAYIVISQLDKIKNENERKKITNLCAGDTRFLKIKKIKQIKNHGEYVYDISTKPHERFICSNILVHNTDFLNMLERSRLKSKKISKTQSVQSQLPVPLEPENIHIGPSDYVPWQNDNKLCFIRIEGRKFGDVPIKLDLKLSVEDSPNSAGVAIDGIRCAKLALDRGVGGALTSISSYIMKSPPVQYPDPVARQMVEEFIKGERER